MKKEKRRAIDDEEEEDAESTASDEPGSPLFKPVPQPGEGEDAFMSRCMVDQTMRKYFPDSDERVVQCGALWRPNSPPPPSQGPASSVSGLLTLESTVSLQAGASKQPKVSITAYTGGAMNVSNFGDIAIDLAGLDMPATVPLLADHSTTLASVAGSGSPRLQDSSLVIEGTLTSTAAGQQIVALARDGVNLQASVGIEPGQREKVKPGDDTTVNGKSIKAGPSGLTVFKSGRLREVSIVPLGADSNTSLTIASRRNRTMPTYLEVDEIQAERARVKAIRQACAMAQCPSVEAKAIDDGWTVEQTKAHVLDLIRASRPKLSGVGANGYGQSGDNPQDVLTAACMLMGGHGQAVVKAFPRTGERLANTIQAPSGYPELCRLALELEGQMVPTNRTELLKAGFSTRSLPVSLGMSVEKSHLVVFLELSQVWMAIGKVIPATNFRQGYAVRLAASSKLERVGLSGELQSQVLGEDAFPYTLATYGKIFQVSREDIINDDAAVLADLPTVLGSESARTVSDLFATVLIGAQTAGYFSTANKNLLTTNPLSITAVASAVAALRSQKDISGRILGLAPSVLLVPASLEFVGSQVLLSTELSRVATGDQLPRGNPLSEYGIITRVEPRLDADSTTSWYLFSKTMYAPLLIATLNGKLGCTVESTEKEAEFLAFGWRAYMDVSVALGEQRASVKSTA
jgi:hypothetical protein